MIYLDFGLIFSLIDNFNPGSVDFNLLSDGFVSTRFETLRNATGYVNKENLRLAAMRNSIDGRWVLPQDYRSGLLKSFGEYVYDILVKDDYPEENIYILEKENMVTPALKGMITELIDNRRGNAVKVNQIYINPRDPNNYVELVFEFNYIGNDAIDVINAAISTYKDLMEFKLRDATWTISSEDMVVDLTKLLPSESSGKFYEKISQEVILEEFTFIRNLRINY